MAMKKWLWKWLKINKWEKVKSMNTQSSLLGVLTRNRLQMPPHKIDPECPKQLTVVQCGQNLMPQ